jgi:hypothetical protein
MTDKKDNTDTPAQKQAATLAGLEAFAAEPPTINNALKFPEIPPKDYDTDKIDEFLSAVFHAELEPDENILTWMVNPTRAPAYPKTDQALLDALDKTKKPKALYYATATCKRDTDDKLYHRKKLFQSLRVVVLDDIGTKVPLDKIPADFIASYVIESSRGNFQYGYVLDVPVRELAAAEALIQLVYESGYTDEGGKTPVKLVRLPDGVNGKKGEKGGFVSKLTSLTGKTYTPQEILDALKIHVKWEDVLADADSVTKRRASKSLGTTPWASITPQAQAMNGFIDPVLEYLYETSQVSLDNGGDWVTIKCPWGEGHTTGEETAGYAPLGRGDDVNTRGFKCFHEHCAAQNTVEFLKFIAATSGIQAGIRDPAAALTTRYVYDKLQNSAWDIKSDKRDLRLPMPSFTGLYPHKTPIQTVGGKEKLVAMTSLWLTSPSRVVVAGATYDPSTTARIVRQQGENFVNLFSIPEWGHGPIDRVHVTQFEEYLEYLIPDADSRAYFLMWAAAKIQDMSFRGAAIVMVAQRQGVGRSTLADMLKTLMGTNNTADVPLGKMISDSEFNEWQEKPFIVSEETLTGDPSKFYNTYEKLKTFIDPRSRLTTINPKFGLKREVEVHGSYLFLTNHENAIAIPDEDRRFFVLTNAHTPAQPSFFTATNKWLKEPDTDGLPLWARHVYRWLLTLDVDIEALTAPPPRNAAKAAMVNASVNDLDCATKMIMDIWPDPYINAIEVFRVLDSPVLAGPLHFDEDTNKKYVRSTVNRNSMPYKCGAVGDLQNGTKARARLIDSARLSGEGVPLDSPKAFKKLSKHYQHRKVDYAAIAAKVADMLREEDRI